MFFRQTLLSVIHKSCYFLLIKSDIEQFLLIAFGGRGPYGRGTKIIILKHHYCGLFNYPLYINLAPIEKNIGPIVYLTLYLFFLRFRQSWTKYIGKNAIFCNLVNFGPHSLSPHFLKNEDKITPFPQNNVD